MLVLPKTANQWISNFNSTYILKGKNLKIEKNIGNVVLYSIDFIIFKEMFEKEITKEYQN